MTDTKEESLEMLAHRLGVQIPKTAEQSRMDRELAAFLDAKKRKRKHGRTRR